MRITVIGLGKMGTALAARLLDAGLDVAVWNRTPGRAAALVDSGASEVAGLEDAAQADVILSAVSDDAALDALRAGGLLATPRDGGVWIECSTVSPEAAERARSAASDRGVAYVCAPVSGNPAVVATGDAVFALSGDDPSALDRAEAILSQIGRATYRVGAGTAATVVKLCVNALLGVTMQALAEIAVVAHSAGVDRAALMQFVNDSAVGSRFTRYKTASVVDLDLTPTFTPEGQRKDMRLALDVARSVDVPTPVISATEIEYARLVASGLGEGKDFASLVLQVARDAGVRLTGVTA